MTRQLKIALILPLFVVAGLDSFFAHSAVGQSATPANLLVSDVGSNSIKEFNGSTGAYMGVFAQGGGLSTPFGMAFGPDGNLYVASLGTNSILEYNGSNGSFIKTFAAQGSGGLFYPNQIAFGPDNNLYVTSYTSNAVLKFEGPNSAHPGTPDGIFATAPGLLGPTGLTFGSIVHNRDGTTNSTTLFVNSSQNGQVFQFNSSTGALIGGGAYINDPAHLSGPAGFAFGLNGNLYETSFTSASANTARGIIQYDTSGAAGSTLSGSLVTSGNLLNGPADIAFDANARKMYVSSYNDSKIYRFNALTGSPSDQGRPFIDSTHLSNPTYILLAPATVIAPILGAPQAVPEPTSLALIGMGAALLYGYSRRRSVTKAAA